VSQKIGKKIYLFPLAVGFAALTGFWGEGFVAALVGITFAGAVFAGAVFAGAPLSGAVFTGVAFVFLVSTLFLLDVWLMFLRVLPMLVGIPISCMVQQATRCLPLPPP
jgi:hypothetical protein